MSARLGSVLARRAMSLARAGVDREPAVLVILGGAERNRVALELARSRVLALVDAQPLDWVAADALEILTAALVRRQEEDETDSSPGA